MRDLIEQLDQVIEDIMPLRSLRVFVTNTPKKLKKIVKRLRQIYDAVQKVDYDSIKYVLDVEAEGRYLMDAMSLTQSPPTYFSQSLDKIQDQAVGMERDADMLKHITVRDFFNMQQSAFEYISERVERVVQAGKILSHKSVRDEIVDNWEGEKDAFPRATLKMLFEMPKLTAELDRTVTSALEKMAATVKIGGKPQVETKRLYHASIKARELYEKGFEKKHPGTEQGLGGDTSGGKVSFTDDVYVAKEIARALKEMAMIAKGQVKPRDILKWAKDDGVYDKVVRSRRELEGKDAEKDKTPIDGYFLYKYYLFHSDRYDPLFIHSDARALLRTLKTTKPRDIGYISARVDMKNPGMDWLSGMREWRVPPEAIQKVEKLVA